MSRYTVCLSVMNGTQSPVTLVGMMHSDLTVSVDSKEDVYPDRMVANKV